MKRTEHRRYLVLPTAAEPVRVLVPRPIPPSPPIEFRGELRRSFDAATSAVGRLNRSTMGPPGHSPCFYVFPYKEAAHSSRLDGLEISLPDLLVYDLKGELDAGPREIGEAAQYVQALVAGLSQLERGTRPTSGLMHELYRVLFSLVSSESRTTRVVHQSHPRLPRKARTFFRSKDRVHGKRPGGVDNDPPMAIAVPACMEELDRYLESADDRWPPLVQAALVQAQLGVILPFPRGNGRLSRLVTTLMLHQAGLRGEPLLNLSWFFQQQLEEYFHRVDLVRHEGDWEAWLEFFLEGVRVSADDAVTSAENLKTMYEDDREQVRADRSAPAAALDTLRLFTVRPICTRRALAARSDSPDAELDSVLGLLRELRIVRRLAGETGESIFVYDRYLEILGEGSVRR